MRVCFLLLSCRAACGVWRAASRQTTTGAWAAGAGGRSQRMPVTSRSKFGIPAQGDDLRAAALGPGIRRAAEEETTLDKPRALSRDEDPVLQAAPAVGLATISTSTPSEGRRRREEVMETRQGLRDTMAPSSTRSGRHAAVLASYVLLRGRPAADGWSALSRSPRQGRAVFKPVGSRCQAVKTPRRVAAVKTIRSTRTPSSRT